MFDGSYLSWNQKRIKGIIDHYGHQFFFYKKVLDLGCGYGDISGVLHRLGADITVVDARQEHLKIVSKKYPGVKTVKTDLDRPWPFFGKMFDCILDMGLLCHLSNFEDHLKSVCASTNYLILETAVADSPDPEHAVVNSDNKNIYDGSFNGFSSQISAANIEKVLKKCGMSFKRMDNAKFNSGPYIYDWQAKSDNSFNIHKRRLWFCVKESQAMVVLPGGADAPTPITLPQTSPGVFSPNLLDSKIPITHQHMMTSRSPTPPQGPHTSPTTIATNVIIPQSGTPQPSFSFVPSYPPENKSPSEYRIAVLISGHLRVFEKTIKSFVKNILGGDKNNIDFFIHTWETLGAPDSKESMDASINNIRTETKVNEIMSLYNPKGFIIEKSTVHSAIHAHASAANMTASEKSGFHGGTIFHYSCMLFSWKKAFQMMESYENETNTKYDLVIKYRTDIIFPDKIDVVNKKIATNTIHIPSIANYYSNGINDQFAFGSRDAVKTYCLLYDNEIDYLNRKVINPLRPETLLRFHLTNYNVNVQPLAVRYYLLRANGTILYPQGANMPTTNDFNLIAHLI